MARFKRRSLLAGGIAVAGVAGLGMSGCSPSQPETGTPVGPGGSSMSPSASSTRLLPPANDVRTLIARSEFVIAHRGSGDNWPEHSLRAYLSSLSAGAQAVEISVRAVKSGELVCVHDADLGRITGSPTPVASLSSLDLASKPIDARKWLGPNCPLEPIPLLSDVLKRLPSDALAFIEDKDGTNSAALFDLLDAEPRAHERFVWKQWAPAGQVAMARDRGYAAWGFFTSDVATKITELSPEFDTIGVDATSSDTVIRRAVATGKPVIIWPVHTRSQAEHFRKLGVAGLMTSNVPYLLSTGAISVRDAFGTGLRSAGDLPTDPEAQWSKSPQLSADHSSVILGSGSAPSYLLGSMCPITEDSYSIRLRFRWRPGKAVTCGVAVGLDDDSPYQPHGAALGSGCRVEISPHGEVIISNHAAGKPPVPVARGNWGAGFSVQDWNQLQIAVTPSEVAVQSAEQTIATARHSDHRGGYFCLWTASVAVPGVEFSGINIA